VRAVGVLGRASGGGAIRTMRHACVELSRIVCEIAALISSTIAAACATTLAPNKR